MKNDWWFKFQYSKWDDPELKECTLETQGFWLRIYLHLRKKAQSSITATVEDLAKIAGGKIDETTRSILDLRKNKAADVTLRNAQNVTCNSRVTLKSRSLANELSSKEKTRLRVAKHRKNQHVTPDVTPHSKSNKKEDKNKKEEIPPTPLLENGNGKGDLDPVSIPVSKPDTELGIWLDAVAVAVGAKDRRTLPKINRWKDVVVAAMREDRGLERLLSAIKAERERVGDQTQFFTPEGVLQKMQMSGSKPAGEKLPGAAERQADLAAERTALKPPPAVSGAKS